MLIFRIGVELKVSGFCDFPLLTQFKGITENEEIIKSCDCTKTIDVIFVWYLTDNIDATMLYSAASSVI